MGRGVVCPKIIRTNEYTTQWKVFEFYPLESLNSRIIVLDSRNFFIKKFIISNLTVVEAIG